MKKEEKILKWRLSEKPTAQSLQDLVKSQIITKEEARQILLDETQYNSKDFEDVLKEIELLRKLVLEISREPQTIIKIIERELPFFPQQRWIEPYKFYCSTNGSIYGTDGITTIKNGHPITNLL